MLHLLVLFDRLWNALSPLKEVWRELFRMLTAAAPYAGWCVGCGVSLALLVLAGVSVFASFEEPDLA